MTAQHLDPAPAPPLADPRHLQTALTAAAVLANRMGVAARLDPADRDDLRQSLLLILVQKAPGYDPRCGAWTTFVSLVLRHAAQEVGDRMARERSRRFVSLEAAEPAVPPYAHHAVEVRLDMARVAAALPDDLIRIWRLRTTASPSGAIRASGLSRAGFHRRLRELRLRALAAGLEAPAPLRPIRGTAGT